jgi:predicted transcriptional regulator
MTRSEIREAIKKVFFEEIEPDSLTKKMSFHSKAGSKKYKSLDGKQNFRSRHEALAYNIFDNEGVLDQIESEAYRFLETCSKIPDFVWENKKIIIEIAGINESLRPGYWKKLEDAKPCLKKQGYTVYIIDTRDRSPYKNYIKFYNYLCKLLGFTPKPEIIDDIYSYVGDPIDLIKRNQEIIQYKKDNPEAGPTEIAKNLNVTYNTVKKILHNANLTIPKSQTLAKIQSRNQEIIQYKKNNPEAGPTEIAKKFNLSLGSIENILSDAGLTDLPQRLARNQKIIKYINDNPELKSKPAKIAKTFNLPVTTIDNILKTLRKSNPTNEQSINNKTMTLKELRKIIRKAMQENMAFKVKGKSGEETVMSLPNATAASDLKNKNSNIASIKPLEEKNK